MLVRNLVLAFAEPERMMTDLHQVALAVTGNKRSKNETPD
jgi:hypothetical protein